MIKASLSRNVIPIDFERGIRRQDCPSNVGQGDENKLALSQFATSILINRQFVKIRFNRDIGQISRHSSLSPEKMSSITRGH